jgi:copper chaperone
MIYYTPARYIEDEGEETLGDTLSYTVPGMNCGHCKQAVTEELTAVEGVESVHVDLEPKLVTVVGRGLDDAKLRAAIDEAGYEAA